MTGGRNVDEVGGVDIDGATGSVHEPQQYPRLSPEPLPGTSLFHSGPPPDGGVRLVPVADYVDVR
ncbi:hypothetical protein [Streptomyces sp. NPDC006477]|uniref:hypothetical protein n=1 Tax=Streptomyces sp. NPDC006477 TaxID=3364747 RepID=UPI003682B900